MLKRKRKQSKYNNTKVENAFGKFDSRKEYRRYLKLLNLQKEGKISELERQKRYVLIPTQKRPDGQTEYPVSYLADFVYLDEEGNLVVEDVKGGNATKTPEYTIKRKLMLQVHSIAITEV